jgi:hypothetical protein
MKLLRLTPGCEARSCRFNRKAKTTRKFLANREINRESPFSATACSTRLSVPPYFFSSPVRSQSTDLPNSGTRFLREFALRRDPISKINRSIETGTAGEMNRCALRSHSPGRCQNVECGGRTAITKDSGASTCSASTRRERSIAISCTIALVRTCLSRSTATRLFFPICVITGEAQPHRFRCSLARIS